MAHLELVSKPIRTI